MLEPNPEAIRMTKTNWTRQQVEGIPTLRSLGNIPVRVQPYVRGAPMYYLDLEGYKWQVFEYDTGKYCKEPFQPW